uniref:Uncharacterized protein n=1 Tax=Rhizophora mucronata TaxID=61149 RepID=A0A2P2MVE9_RHIMU
MVAFITNVESDNISLMFLLGGKITQDCRDLLTRLSFALNNHPNSTNHTSTVQGTEN